MSGAKDDYRDGPRTPIELRVEYKKVNSFFYDYTRNISKGGTFIRTDRPLDVGTEFVFKLMVPSLSEPLTLRGEVRWVVSPEKNGQDDNENVSAAESGEAPAAGMGIQFVYSTDGERERVEQTVEGLMKEHLGDRAFTKLMGKG